MNDILLYLTSPNFLMWYKGDKYEKVRMIRNDTYVNLLLSEGITLPTALAAPVEEGIKLLLTL